MLFVDTNVAIDIRDGAPFAEQRLALLPEPPVLSFVTRIELEGGVYRDPQLARQRRMALDSLLAVFPVIPLTDADADTYGRIVAAQGFSRRQILVRLIAAQALNRGARLATANHDDFADVPGLHLIAW